MCLSCRRNGASNLSVDSDMELLKLALSCSAALLMLGSAAVSNPVFSSILVQGIFHLMEKLQQCIPVNQAYRFCSDIGLKREFLEKFGSRAADNKKWRDEAEEEFWVYLVHQLLRRALVREGVRLRVKSRDTIEVSRLCRNLGVSSLIKLVLKLHFVYFLLSSEYGYSSTEYKQDSPGLVNLLR